MTDLGYLVVVGFAVFRVWRLLAVDNITAGLRASLPDRVLNFVRCPWCFGFWLAVAAYLALREWGDNEWWVAFTVILALSGLVGLLAHATGDDQ